VENFFLNTTFKNGLKNLSTFEEIFSAFTVFPTRNTEGGIRVLWIGNFMVMKKPKNLDVGTLCPIANWYSIDRKLHADDK
jgi:hypothetical protein